ncbi:hypothetical protein Tco_1004393 [Tanacetum coccineum]|uniref:Uncharacterized protein n=1 Tax=Tanacetum coccineum TaxID=301880 RepID=A0ABQ5FC32_9ASTR
MDFDFIPSHNDLGSNLDDSSPSGDSNKIYDPGICIEVESTRFLATLSPERIFRKMTKTKPKPTKPSTGLKRVQKVKVKARKSKSKIQSQDEVINIFRARDWKEHEISNPTVPSSLIGVGPGRTP